MTLGSPRRAFLPRFSAEYSLVGFAVLHVYSELRGGIDVRLARWPLAAAVPAAAAGGMLLFFLWPSQYRPFIYFQF